MDLIVSHDKHEAIEGYKGAGEGPTANSGTEARHGAKGDMVDVDGRHQKIAVREGRGQGGGSKRTDTKEMQASGYILDQASSASCPSLGSSEPALPLMPPSQYARGLKARLKF